MAYSVVIVEDEEIIREELAKTTPWESLGLRLAGTAEDGISGEEMIRSLVPDVVITDIRLPGQDGLTMLSRCPISYAVILSGHADFSYMKTAIRLGVFDYILKPVDDEELLSTLKALVKKLQEEDQDLTSLKISINKIEDEPIGLPKKSGNHLAESCINFIMENYQHPIGLQEAADAFGVTESHLSRIFKESLGINFMQYLNAWRINKAVSLIKNPRVNIGKVASLCGFPTPGYFTRTFKRYTGVTPSQYRHQTEL